MTDPSPRDLEAWYAYRTLGSSKKAGKALGVHEVTIRKRISALRDIFDARDNIELDRLIRERYPTTPVVANTVTSVVT